MATGTTATETTAGETTAGGAFDLSAGELCLDFANTLNGRASGELNDRLPEYGDLVAWAQAAGAVGESEAAALLQRARRRPEAAAAVHRRALDLREALFRLFASAAAGEESEPADLDLLNRELSNALCRRHLVAAPDREGFLWAWCSAEELDAVLAPVVLSAADLAASGDLDRVRECAAGTCRWLFLDRSRNRSRRWCDMSACGNRAKARRHYRRRGARRSARPTDPGSIA